MTETASTISTRSDNPAVRIGTHFWDLACRALVDDLDRPVFIGGLEYEVVEPEATQYAALGYDPENPDGPLVIRRVSDGQCFELEIQVSAHEVSAGTPVTGLDTDGGHIPLGRCDWVHWGPCGCPFGVAMAATPNITLENGTVLAGERIASEEIAWRGFFDSRTEEAAARKHGHRVELISHERWCSEVSALMLAGCPHRSQEPSLADQ